MSAHHHYFSRFWRHMVPHQQRLLTLGAVAEMITEFDVVALQELDSGSYRSQFVDHIEYLAQQAGFPYWAEQTTRKFGTMAQHAKGMLSRYPIVQHDDIRLPGPLPGRGFLAVELEVDAKPLTLVNVHLSLGRQTQQRQLDCIAEWLDDASKAVIMGDFNMPPERLQRHDLVTKHGFQLLEKQAKTYPSWRPRKVLDYFLLSSDLCCLNSGVITCQFSDHLPIWAQVRLV